MNENGYLNSNGDNIGIDPSVVPVIESLDFTPGETYTENKTVKKVKTNKSNDDKGPSLIKKILFTLVVLALMAGVAFGVYYYLSLGRNVSTSTIFSLMDKSSS